MIDVAEKVIVLAAFQTKIRGFGKICNLNKIDVLITDSSIDNETKRN
jgi:DeoR/GlpR family transcriptional regulator of sugar metabolism